MFIHRPQQTDSSRTPWTELIFLMERLFRAQQMFLLLFHRLLLLFHFWNDSVKVCPGTPFRPWAALCCSSHGLAKVSKEHQHCHWLFWDLPRFLNGHWRILAAAIGHMSWNAPINNQRLLFLTSFIVLKLLLTAKEAEQCDCCCIHCHNISGKVIFQLASRGLDPDWPFVTPSVDPILHLRHCLAC